jgi:dimethylargininase
VSILNGYDRLRRVLVRVPDPASASAWHDYGWRAEPVGELAGAQHAAFRACLEDAGAEVVVGAAPAAGNPDAIYAYDPTLILDDGAVLLRPGKPGRRGEPAAAAADLREAGLEVLGEIEAPGTAEGGDMVLLDASTLLVGHGYRTNAEGIRQLRELLDPREVVVEAFDLPHYLGPAACLHLMSFFSPLDADLAVVYLPMMPVRLVELLSERGIDLIEVPEEEFESMGPNVLALAPRVALAVDGNPRTRRLLEGAGVDVRVFEGSEISGKGDGGPTCLTRPLARG